MTRGWTLVAIAAVLALSAGLDGALHAHVDFPGYYAVFGLVAAVAVILASAGLGRLGLRRPDRGGDPTGASRRDDPTLDRQRSGHREGGHG